MTRVSFSPALPFGQCCPRGWAGFPNCVFHLLPSAILLTFFVCSAFAADFGFGHGTAVVVLRSPKAVYAAVDSKVLNEEYTNGQLSVGESQECKIGRIGPYYTIVAGMMRGTNGFNALQEVASAYRPGETLEALGQSLQQSVPRMLAPMLATLLKQDPAAFARHYGAYAPLHLTLLGNEQNTPKVVVVEFKAEPDASGDVSLATRTMSCPGDCPAPNAGYFLGAHEAVEASVQQNPAVLTKPNEQELERLIGLEYASRPDIVGGPITMLRVSPAGSAVLRSGACSLN